MELKRVELYNFSSYAGKSTFDFSTSKDKNIILIGALLKSNDENEKIHIKKVQKFLDKNKKKGYS